MNILGHALVASKMTSTVDGWTLAGSHLPDIVPFVPNSIFRFEEIHEGGTLVLVENKNLGVAMISHGVKYGADKYNTEIEKWLIGDDCGVENYLAERISKTANIDLKTARESRMHNWLWTGIDCYVLKNKRDFVDLMSEKWSEIEVDKTAQILSKVFSKEIKKVIEEVEYFIKVVDAKELNTVEGLVNIYKNISSGLPEKDRIDSVGALELTMEIYKMFENKWEEILNNVIERVWVSYNEFIWRK